MSDLGPLNDEIDTLMGTLRAELRDIRVFFQVFASKLMGALPDVVEVEREGSLFSAGARSGGSPSAPGTTSWRRR